MKNLFLVLLLPFLFLECSEKPEPASEKSGFNLSELARSEIRYKVDLISLKHGIESEAVKSALVEFFLSPSMDPPFAAMDDEARQEYVETLFQRFIDKRFPTKELMVISEVHNVPIKTLAAIVYDFQVLEAAEDCPE